MSGSDYEKKKERRSHPHAGHGSREKEGGRKSISQTNAWINAVDASSRRKGRKMSFLRDRGEEGYTAVFLYIQMSCDLTLKETYKEGGRRRKEKDLAALAGKEKGREKPGGSVYLLVAMPDSNGRANSSLYEKDGRKKNKSLRREKKRKGLLDEI